MAKRKRLTPADPDYLTPPPVLETKAWLRPGLPEGAAPIAQVAGEASAAAALAEVAATLTAARDEGRLVQRLPLAAIETDHLVRDRLGTDEEELALLMTSLAAHGQRTPIEVTPLAANRFGLISGWRRMAALSRLRDTTGEARFGTVLALVRRPDSAAAAYVAMVEENEVRLGLSYYERARIVGKAVDLGVFETEKAALQQLFASASRPRRSKIGSFLTIYRALDPALRFPAAIPERLGLSLAKMIETEPGRTGTLQAALLVRPAPYAIDELALLADAVEAAETPPDTPRKQRTEPRQDVGRGEEVSPGVFLRATGQGALTLAGPGVDAAFRARLEVWLTKG